jgi:hypothetical protein
MRGASATPGFAGVERYEVQMTRCEVLVVEPLTRPLASLSAHVVEGIVHPTLLLGEKVPEGRMRGASAAPGVGSWQRPTPRYGDE